MFETTDIHVRGSVSSEDFILGKLMRIFASEDLYVTRIESIYSTWKPIRRLRLEFNNVPHISGDMFAGIERLNFKLSGFMNTESKHKFFLFVDYTA